MERRPPQAETRTATGRRLVLITSEEPTEPASPTVAPLRIIGSEPRPSGGFRLTDR